MPVLNSYHTIFIQMLNIGFSFSYIISQSAGLKGLIIVKSMASRSLMYFYAFSTDENCLACVCYLFIL